MAPTLILNSNNAGNGNLSVDVSQYLDLTPDSDMDTYDPGWSNKVLGHSLLREGATLALEDRQAKELTFPVKFNAASRTAVQLLVTQVNQILSSPGATYSWQDTGTSQPTIFDSIIGEFQVKYKYREQEKFWVTGDLKLTTQPFGRATGPRPYAAASGVGPLLIISPYASSGANVLGASTQAGVSGFGGQQQGASSGVFYWGNPSMIGDAPALLQISYVGPLPNTATNTGVVPNVAVSLLPDQFYQPLITAPEIAFANLNGVTSRRIAQTSVASSYVQLRANGQINAYDTYSFTPLGAPSDIAFEPTRLWEGQHRLFAIARASVAGAGANAALSPQAGPLVKNSTVATIAPGPDWGLYDLGTFGLRASAFPQTSIQIRAALSVQAGASAALDLAALVMLPDSATWFMNPTQIIPSQYGYPINLASAWGAGGAAWTNTLLLDDVVGDQYLYLGTSQSAAPSPLGSTGSATSISAYARGLMPRPDPKNGVPIIAILGVGQPADQALSFPNLFPLDTVGPVAGGSATNDAGVGTTTWTATTTTSTCSLPAAADVSEYLKLTAFGFAIPTGATIVGITATLAREGTGNLIEDNAVRLVKAGTVQTTDRSATGAWPAAPTAITYGGSSDLWGGTWAPSDINNSGFGFAISAVNFNPQTETATVSNIQITVYYTFGTGPPVFSGASQANPQNLRTMAQVSVMERSRYILP